MSKCLIVRSFGQFSATTRSRWLFMDIDKLLWLAGLLAEAFLICVFLRKKSFRDFPLFCGYTAWTLLTDLLAYVLRTHLPLTYQQLYITGMFIDSLFQFAVLVELGWALLKPLHRQLPRITLPVLALLIALCGVLLWPLVGLLIPNSWPQMARIYVHLQQTVAILRILIFLLMAGLSQLLALGWRDRELQIASGFGLYSFASLCVSTMHDHVDWLPYFSLLDRFLAISYIGVLLYWIWSFALHEEQRHPFTPQMQQILLALSSSATLQQSTLSAQLSPRQKKK